MINARAAGAWIIAFMVGGCSIDDPDLDDLSGGANTPDASSSSGTGGAAVDGARGAGGELDLRPGGAPDGASTGPDGGSCESASSEATMKPVVLAFAFDVSGSMGEGDFPWHDRALKWDPVVAATEAFFTAPSSDGITASVTFFPEDADDIVKCVASTYETPDVPLTALPSSKFGEAITVVEGQEWGDGTPTIFVVRGTIAFLRGEAMRNPEPTYALVLVTDGYPADCNDGGENDIDTVAVEVAAVAGTIPTYVIGVANPPIEDAPDVVSDLHRIAQSGGTDQAFIIDTGDPAKTTASFRAAIDSIRGTAVSCTVGIPPVPVGKIFDKEKVAVTYESAASKTDLAYDAQCSTPNTWRYDDPASPTEIVLCDATCTAVQVDPLAKLVVSFTCERQIVIR